MNTKERDELLIRLDERVKTLYTWRQESMAKEAEDRKESKAQSRHNKGLWFTALLAIVMQFINNPFK